MTEMIRLGGREFALRPLTVGQLRHLLDALDEMSGASGGALIDAAGKLVKTGLAAPPPDGAVEAGLGAPPTLSVLNATVAAILQMAGLHPKEPGPGEAGPVASEATPGAA